MNDLDKVTYLRMRKAFGNGNERKGRAIMQAIALRLEEARDKHPVYAERPYHALGVISSEFHELEMSVEHETESRQMDEALDVIATSVRYLREEYK